MSLSKRHLEALEIAAATPRFSPLTICVRGALFGFGHPGVRHMIDRNREVEMHRHILTLETQKANPKPALLHSEASPDLVGAPA